MITIYYSFREDGLANNQTEREHGDVQIKVAIPGNILYNKQNRLFCKIKWDDILVELYCRAFNGIASVSHDFNLHGNTKGSSQIIKMEI